MSDKLRSVNTRFWEDSFIEGLNPNEKLIFLYLLTNPMTNLIGIYEITIKRISYDTALKKDIVLKALEGFERLNKVLFYENHIVLINFLKNQCLNDNMKIGVLKLFSELPISLKVKLLGNDYQTLSNDYISLRNALVKLNIEKEYEIEMEKEREIVKSKSQFIPPTIEEVEIYFEDNGYSIESAHKAFNYYALADWHDSKGSKVKNWKQKMQAVWFKEENRIKPDKKKVDGYY